MSRIVEICILGHGVIMSKLIASIGASIPTHTIPKPYNSTKLKRRYFSAKSMRFILPIIITLTLIMSACTVTGGVTTEPDECSSFQDAAKDNCYFEIHKCSKISNEKVRDSCVAELAAIKGELKVCNLIKSEEAQGYCQQQIAEKDNNFQLCKEISSPYWKDNCNYNIALNTNEDTLCLLIGDFEQSQECLNKIALETNNHLLCNLLEPEEKFACVSKIAKETGNAEICGVLTPFLKKDTCILRVAKSTEKQELCEQISFAEGRQICNDHFL